MIEATNEGPGDAERVGIQVKLPGQKWGKPWFSPLVDRRDVLRGRSIELPLVAVDGDQTNLPRGKYEFRILFRRMPNTTKVRRKRFSRAFFTKVDW